MNTIKFLLAISLLLSFNRSEACSELERPEINGKGYMENAQRVIKLLPDVSIKEDDLFDTRVNQIAGAASLAWDIRQSLGPAVSNVLIAKGYKPTVFGILPKPSALIPPTLRSENMSKRLAHVDIKGDGKMRGFIKYGLTKGAIYKGLKWLTQSVDEDPLEKARKVLAESKNTYTDFFQDPKNATGLEKYEETGDGSRL